MIKNRTKISIAIVFQIQGQINKETKKKKEKNQIIHKNMID